MPEYKSLNWKPTAGIGYTVVRRPDGGMYFTFLDVSPITLQHWREFASQHLYNSDRLTRNLYDLRALETIPEEAIRFAVEINSDPAARNIRLAVVTANNDVGNAIRKIAALTPGAGAEAKIFTDLTAAEDWLTQSLEKLV
jgi:hypothetical protein